MGRKRERSQPRVRLSPNETVAHLTDDFIQQLAIPALPERIPDRLSEALTRRVLAYLYHLREARQKRFIPAFEIRLVRDAQRAVHSAYELGLPDSEVHYATFRALVEELGYERTEVGFRRKS